MSQLPTLQPIDSSMLTGMHHDPHTQTLTVQYKGKDGEPGAVWQHDGVGAEKAHSLEHSDSPGRYFNDKIRNVHPGRKVG